MPCFQIVVGIHELDNPASVTESFQVTVNYTNAPSWGADGVTGHRLALSADRVVVNHWFGQIHTCTLDYYAGRLTAMARHRPALDNLETVSFHYPHFPPQVRHIVLGIGIPVSAREAYTASVVTQ